MRTAIISVFLMISSFVYSQKTSAYIDVLTAPAMLVYSGTLKSSQDDTNQVMREIKEKQEWINAQMLLANNIQNKVYKGLSEANSIVTNGIQAKNIVVNISKMPGNLKDVYNAIADQPEYSIFGIKAGQLVAEKTMEYYSEINDLLKNGDLNLMTSGDRMVLLSSLEMKTRMLNLFLINIKYTILRAKARGWWRSINPFQGYVDIDKNLFDHIIKQAAYMKL